MTMQSAWNANGICAVRTKFKAEKGAKIRLVQLNLLSQNFRFINDVGAECEDNAAAEILQLLSAEMKPIQAQRQRFWAGRAILTSMSATIARTSSCLI